MIFNIKTTGTAPIVVINDLGDRTFVHPFPAVLYYDLGKEYTDYELMNSADLQAAITAGTMQVRDAFGNFITDLSQLGGLQAAYNNSTSLEIHTTASLGPVSIRRGTALDTDIQFAIENSATTKVFSITADGTVLGDTFNGVALAIGGGGATYLDDAGNYSTPPHQIDIGDGVTGGTVGSVLFVGTGAILAQDNANLFWNDTSNRLGIGTDSPNVTLEIVSTTIQQTWSYDADSRTTMTVLDDSHTTLGVGETGNLTLDVGGNIELNADGGTITFKDASVTLATIASLRQQTFILACSDETTALTTGAAKVTFRMPYAFTLTSVTASLTTAGTGANLVTVDINEGGSTILSTKITIDATEKTSTTAATAPVISDAALASDAEMTIDIDQIDSGGVSAGLKVALIGYQTI